MKKLIALFLVLLSLMALILTGCSAIFRVSGTGDIIEKTYNFKDFTAVEISNDLHYEVKRSDSYSVAVSTHENSFKYLDIHQSGNTLYAGHKSCFYHDANTMVTITLPQLNRLAISGACEGKASGFDSTGDMEIIVSGASNLDTDFKAGKTGLAISGASEITGNLTSAAAQIKLSGASELNMLLKSDRIELDATGSSNIRGDLQTRDTLIKLSGASECKLTGSAGNTVIDASGSCEVDSPGLSLQNADVKLSGASHADILTDGMLNFDLSGASTLDYGGHPTLGKTSITGASDLNPR